MHFAVARILAAINHDCLGLSCMVESSWLGRYDHFMGPLGILAIPLHGLIVVVIGGLLTARVVYQTDSAAVDALLEKTIGPTDIDTCIAYTTAFMSR